MGAITGLLLLPVMAPVWGFHFVLEKLRDEAEAVLYDEGRGFAELIDLSMRRSAGKISDAEFAEQEAALLERLSSIRDYREELLNAELNADDDQEPWVDAEPEMVGDESVDAELADAELADSELIDAEPAMCEVER